MKSLKIPDKQIYNAYLITGEDAGLIMEAALDFARRILKRGDVWQDRGFSTVEDWEASVDKRVENDEHPDLILIRPDKPEENPRLVSVDNIRDNLNGTVDIRPYEADYKIYIVLNADQMNQAAQNAILKTLEEPPEYVVIMLLASHADAFLPTIMSRVIEIKAGERDTEVVLMEYLSEEWAEETLRFMSEIENRDSKEILDYIKSMTDKAVPLERLLGFIDILLRDVLCYKSTRDESLLYGKGDMADITVKLARTFSYEKLGEVTSECDRAKRGMQVNVNKDLQLESLLFKLRENRG